jgi:hypothetical protein
VPSSLSHAVSGSSLSLFSDVPKSVHSLAFIVYYICFNQMQSNLISQASQMNAGGTPNDLLPAMNKAGCIILAPLVQYGLYPILHRLHLYPSPVTRIAIGFAFITASMLYATIIQHVIYRSPPCYNQFSDCSYNFISVWVQAPVYFLISAGEIFAYVTALSYTYELSPGSMKVVVQAVVLLIGAAGSACAIALSPLAQNPYLVYYYAALTAGMGLTTAIFWLVFKSGSKTAQLHPAFKEIDPLPIAVLEPAPRLKPINAGEPIRISSILMSRLSRSYFEDEIVGNPPELPRRSSRRPRLPTARNFSDGTQILLKSKEVGI